MSSTTKPEIRNKDMLAVKAYIMAKDATQYDDVHKDTVILDLTHSNLIQKHIEIRFELHDTFATPRRLICRLVRKNHKRRSRFCAPYKSKSGGQR